MMWWVLWAIFTVVGIVCWIIGYNIDCDGFIIYGEISTVIMIMAVLILAGITSQVYKEESEFIKAKYIVENGNADDYYELDDTPAVYNAWLRTAQYQKEKAGIWSFYSGKVFSLEPIELGGKP
jgi:hypothetical protein